MQHRTQSFNDGVVKIYAVGNVSPLGSKPKEQLTLKGVLRYKERTVGLTRFWTAKQASVNIRYVLRCPLLRDVSTKDVAIPNDGKQYKIIQVQYPEDIEPPVMDLTLEEVSAVYGIS